MAFYRHIGTHHFADPNLSLNLLAYSIAESESGFGLDSVKPSIQCANPDS